MNKKSSQHFVKILKQVFYQFLEFQQYCLQRSRTVFKAILVVKITCTTSHKSRKRSCFNSNHNF